MRRTTQKNIQKVIGSFDEFILTTMSSQNNSMFIDKTQKERKELLSQFMGLTIFDGCTHQTPFEDIKEVDTLLKNFKAIRLRYWS